MWILRGFCGDFANFLDGAHKFFFASLFGAHSRANLFPNRDLFAVGEHQNAILFPNRHNAATGEHHRATAFPNRHQITQRALKSRDFVPVFISIVPVLYLPCLMIQLRSPHAVRD